MSSLRAMPDSHEDMNVEFIVDYDENNIASYNLPMSIIYDKPERALVFCFSGYSSSK
jgi:hypothetical protein